MWHMTCYQPPLRSTSYCKTVRRRDVTSRRRRLQWCWTSSIKDETSPTGTQCCRAWSTTNRTRRTRHPSHGRWPSAWVSSWWHWVSVIIMHSLRVLITLIGVNLRHTNTAVAVNCPLDLASFVVTRELENVSDISLAPTWLGRGRDRARAYQSIFKMLTSNAVLVKKYTRFFCRTRLWRSHGQWKWWQVYVINFCGMWVGGCHTTQCYLRISTVETQECLLKIR